MHDLLNEQLSALADGELPPEETALLLRRLEREPQLRALLARYALAGDVLRGERLQAGPQFAMRVAQALIAEPAHAPALTGTFAAASAAETAGGAGGAGGAGAQVAVRRTPAAASHWLRPLAGFAVAATVAGLAVFVLKRDPVEPAVMPVAALGARDLTRTPSGGAGEATAVLARTERAPAGGSEPASYVTPARRPRVGAIPPGELVNYVVAHVQFITPIGRGGVITSLVADEAPAEPTTR